MCTTRPATRRQTVQRSSCPARRNSAWVGCDQGKPLGRTSRSSPFKGAFAMVPLFQGADIARRRSSFYERDLHALSAITRRLGGAAAKLRESPCNVLASGRRCPRLNSALIGGKLSAVARRRFARSFAPCRAGSPIDGRPAKVIPVSHIIAGVVVPPGAGEIRFKIRRWPLLAGRALVGLAVIVVALRSSAVARVPVPLPVKAPIAQRRCKRVQRGPTRH